MAEPTEAVEDQSIVVRTPLAIPVKAQTMADGGVRWTFDICGSSEVETAQLMALIRKAAEGHQVYGELCFTVTGKEVQAVTIGQGEQRSGRGRGTTPRRTAAKQRIAQGRNRV